MRLPGDSDTIADVLIFGNGDLLLRLDGEDKDVVEYPWIQFTDKNSLLSTQGLHWGMFWQGREGSYGKKLKNVTWKDIIERRPIVVAISEFIEGLPFVFDQELPVGLRIMAAEELEQLISGDCGKEIKRAFNEAFPDIFPIIPGAVANIKDVEPEANCPRLAVWLEDQLSRKQLAEPLSDTN